MFAADELGQVLGLLGFIAVAIDLIHAQIAVCAIGQTYGSASTRDFFHRDHMGQIAHIGSAVLLRHRDAQHAQVTKLAPQVHGELVIAIDLSRTRSNLALGKLTHCITQSIDIFSKLEIQSGQVGKAHGCLLQVCMSRCKYVSCSVHLCRADTSVCSPWWQSAFPGRCRWHRHAPRSPQSCARA